MLDHVEQQLLDRPEQESLERLRLRSDVAVRVHVNHQAMLGLHLVREPAERLGEIGVVHHGGAQLVGQAAGFLDRVFEHVVDLRGRSRKDRSDLT